MIFDLVVFLFFAVVFLIAVSISAARREDKALKKERTDAK